MTKKTELTENNTLDQAAAESTLEIFGNQKVKDHLFKRAFRDKKHLLELYNALNGSSYTDDADLEITTMEDVIFLKMKNDLSFIVGNTLNLYGHQSTINSNIALRAFLYFGQQYEAIAKNNPVSIYGHTQIPLPFPMCVVFYNGDTNIEDESVIKMSSAFAVPDGKDIGNLVPAVECTVRILNINPGHNNDLAQKCSRMDEYSKFVQIIREHRKSEPDLGRSLKNAVDQGIEEGLLLDILIPEKAGIISMLLTEFDEEKYRRTIYEEGRMEERAIADKKYAGIIAEKDNTIASQKTEIARLKDEKDNEIARLKDEKDNEIAQLKERLSKYESATTT